MPGQKQKKEKQIPPEDMQRIQDLETQQAELKRENEELRKALLRLENLWAKYYELYEHLPIGYFIIEKEGLIQEVNPSGANLLGVERSKLVKQSFSSFVVKEDLNPFYFFFQKISQAHIIKQTCHLRMAGKNGASFFAQLQGLPMESKGGDIHQIIAVADITPIHKQLELEIIERRRLEEELKNIKGEDMSELLLLEPARDGICILENGFFRFANHAMEIITGYTVEEILNNISYFDFVIEEDRARVIRKTTLQPNKGKKSSSLYEAKIQQKDGNLSDIRVSATYIEYHGQPACMKIIRDITEIKRREEECLKMEKLESIGVLAAGIAHDFNNFLSVVIGNLSLAELKAKSEAPLLEILSRAKRASRRAVDLTRQLLNFSKGSPPTKKITSIAGLLQDTANFVIRGSRARCEFTIPDNLWPVEIDEGQISQVISNLLINAEQAMPNGGIITLKAEKAIITSEDALPLEEGKYIKISLKDQGIGIPEENLSKIFDPYFTTKAEGSGLGLATSYSIIKRHEGLITAESEEGAGSSFHIYLPVAEKELFTVKDILEVKPHFGKGKILVMDDDQDIRDITGQMLVQLGYEVELAADGGAAVILFQKARESGRPFDAVILDLIVQGGMGGDEAVQRMMEIDPNLKAIVSSAYANYPGISEYKKYGFQEVITKPYEIQELGKVLYEVIAVPEKAYSGI